ncbi:MAG TPA: response regulator transcription factor [Thermoleophilia bacterium]|nr:response regulator transcription factor [Thermoleophilia bacterium]
MARIRVLLADDHTILRQGIHLLLDHHPVVEVVGEAADGLEAVERARALEPDVVVMDLAMPGMSGLDAAKEIRKTHPEIQIIALTVHENEEYLFQMLKAGACGYVLKRAAATELVAAIEAAHRGESYIHPLVAKKMIVEYLHRVGNGQEHPLPNGLTDRERQIVKMVAEGHTNRQIAEILYLSIKTIQAHRAHVMEKLHVHDSTGLVRYAVKTGLVDPD